MLRILQEGDLRCKTENSTTFLHESVKHGLPPVFVARLFSLDCPLEEREEGGLTARQLAVRAGNQLLVQVTPHLGSALIHPQQSGHTRFILWPDVLLKYYP